MLSRLFAAFLLSVPLQAQIQYGRCTPGRYACPTIGVIGSLQVNGFALIVGASLMPHTYAILLIGTKPKARITYPVNVHVDPVIVIAKPVTGARIASWPTPITGWPVAGKLYFQIITEERRNVFGLASSAGLLVTVYP